MLGRTHLAITLFFVMLFFSAEANFLLFLPVSLFAALLPDIDTRFSGIGKHKISRIINFFTKHRGIIHSFSFLFASLILIFIFFREILIPFALGYALHLIADCFTVQGVRVFYPLKLKIRGKIRTGGIAEFFILAVFSLADLFLIFNYFFSVF